MPIKQNAIILSRYFYDNVMFVANICPKCYEEAEDLRIISINFQFLKQINTNAKIHDQEFLTKKKIKEKTLSITAKVTYNMYQKRYLKNMRKQMKNKWKFYYRKLINTSKYLIETEIIDNEIKKTDFEDEYLKKNELKISGSLWTPPKSPHNLIEECLYKDPWALLVATIFLNKTSCITARPYIFWFLTENPDPLTVLDKFPSDLEKYFVNLGLVKTKVVQIYRMSYDFLFKQWESVRQLYGIGDYGECAYRMFCLGDFNVEPKDRFLKIYKAWHKKFHENC